MNEPYWNEKHNSSGNWGSGGGGSGSGGGGGGSGGGGSGSTAGWGENDNAETLPQWGGPNLPFLKIGDSGELLSDHISKYLLIGSASCAVSPHLIMLLNGNSGASHRQCVLWRCSNNRVQFSNNTNAWFEHLRPGEYLFEAKFQAGHWNHAETSGARFIVFGVDIGFLVLPLRVGQYREIFTLKITENFTIYVNSICGTVHGNEKFGV